MLFDRMLKFMQDKLAIPEGKKLNESKVNEEIDDLLEKVSSLVHDEWMAWAKDILKSEKISLERVKRWETECFKPYEELTEEMKEYDMEWGRKFIKLLQPSAAEANDGKENETKLIVKEK